MRTMRASLISILLFAFWLVPMHTMASTLFTASLDGSQEVPVDTGSTATGFATLELNAAQTRLEISLQLTGLDLDGSRTPADVTDDVVGLHIHSAPVGANGPVVFGFINPNSDLNGDLVIDAIAGTVVSAWDLTEGNGTSLTSQLPALFNDGLYFNVHTVTYPPGEIRGQITKVPAPSVLALFALGFVGIGLVARSRRRICT